MAVDCAGKSLEEIFEVRLDLGKQMANYLETQDKELGEGAEWPEDVQQRWDEMNADYEAYAGAERSAKRARERAERLSQLDVEKEVQERDFFDRGRTEREVRRQEPEFDVRMAQLDAIQAWMRCNNPTTELGLEERHTLACQRLGVNPNAPYLDVHYPEGFDLRSDIPVWVSRGQTTGTFERRAEIRDEFRRVEERQQSTVRDGSGGELVPIEFLRNLEEAQLYFGGPRNVATILRTPNGRPLDMPSVDDTANSGEDVAENTASNDQDITTALQQLMAYKNGSGVVKVSAELMEDSAWTMAQIVNPLLAKRLARRQSAETTVGDGSTGANGHPQGIVTGSALGITAAGTTDVTGDELIDAFHSVDVTYRNAAFNFGWMMHDLTVAKIRKLKMSTAGAGDLQYLWQPGLQAGQPDMLLDAPVSVNNDMPVAAASAKPILVGPFTSFWVREVAAVRFYQLNELFRVSGDQTGFVAFQRIDSRVYNAGDDPIKNITMAAS